MDSVTQDRPKTGKKRTIYRVKDPDGRLVAEHVRQDNPDGTKQVLWRQTDGTSGLNGTKLRDLPLYGCEFVGRWDRDRIVVLVEGEKAALALHAIKIPAVGTVTGAGGVPGRKALEVLRGFRVALWADNDDQGRNHMRQIAALLDDIASEVLVFTWDEAPDKGDAADHPAVRNGDRKARERLLTDLEGAPRWEGVKPKMAPVGMVLANVESESVTWLWDRRIPRGKLTVIDGDPDLGKSALSTDLAARVTVGRDFPDGATCQPGGVVVMNAEDGLADTIRPRFDAAGGDANMVLALASVPDKDGYERILSIPEDIPIIERGIQQVGATLVVIDPLMAFLSPEINAHKDQDVRRGLAPLAAMAERTGAAVVVVRHLNKMAGGNTLYRGGGSIGIIGAARSGLVVGMDPQAEERRILAPTKGNLSKKPPSLIYRITTAENGAARVEWQGESTLSANDLVQVPDSPEEKSALGEAIEFLENALEKAPMASVQLYEDADKAGISRSTLKRAKRARGVKAVHESDGFWSWQLPKVEEGKGTTDPLTHEHESLDPLDPLAPTHHGAREAYVREGDQGDQENLYGESDPLDDTLDDEEEL